MEQHTNAFKHIHYSISNAIVTITLNRPEKRNALNLGLIEEIREVLPQIKHNNKIRVVIFEGAGKSFCAGADIGWLKSMKEASEASVVNDFSQLGHLLNELYLLPQITIVKVHGAVYGGGLGLMAAADFVMAHPETKMAFSEINIGMVAATIAPFVLNRVHINQVKKLFYSGEVFSAKQALEIGLVDNIFENELESELQEFIGSLLQKPANALKETKKLLNKPLLTNPLDPASTIATLIKGAETGELFDRFLGK